MENNVKVFGYLKLKHPKQINLTELRVMKLLYLIEWKYAITTGKRLTSMIFEQSTVGPLCIHDFSQDNLSHSNVEYNESQQTITIDLSTLSEDTKEVIDFVINQTKDLSWKELDTLVNSTYGAMNTRNGNIIDIQNLAGKYIQEYGTNEQ